VLTRLYIVACALSAFSLPSVGGAPGAGNTLMHICTETGLYRVNGAQFDSTLGEQIPSSSIWSLYADADGEWIGYLFGRANLVHQGEVTHFPRDRMPAGAGQFITTSDGAVWVATTGGMAKFIRIDCTAPLLRNPERVNFRNRLAGIDTALHEAGLRRKLYYRNLSSGEPRFELTADNGDGRWSEHEVLTFHVAAAFYQTAWFRSLAVLLVTVLFALIVIVRTEQTKARIRQHIVARTYERERIARDLHDTLLQGVQSLLLRTDIWANDRSLSADLRSEIYEVSEQAREIVIEARERIVLLRNGDSKESDLIATLKRMANARAANEAPSLEIIIRGAPRALTNDAYQQLVDIAREAVRNAIQHAKCQHIRVTVAYHSHSIVLVIADDGCGITPTLLLADTSAGHYGILGMQERAQQLDAEFALGPNGTLGTKVLVHVPAEIAFADTPRRSGWSDLLIHWWRRGQAKLFQ
jgi:signal transduction histidine kinase